MVTERQNPGGISPGSASEEQDEDTVLGQVESEFGEEAVNKVKEILGALSEGEEPSEEFPEEGLGVLGQRLEDEDKSLCPELPDMRAIGQEEKYTDFNRIISAVVYEVERRTDYVRQPESPHPGVELYRLEKDSLSEDGVYEVSDNLRSFLDHATDLYGLD